MSRIRTSIRRCAPALVVWVLAAGAVSSTPAQADTAQASARPVVSTGTLGAHTAPGGKVTRRQIVARARSWVDQKVPFSSNGLQAPFSWWSDETTGGAYRQDCSGFVSMAWQLPRSLTTRSLGSVAERISFTELKPGDILNSPSHVVLFGGWENRAEGTFHYYQQSNRSRPAHKAFGSLNADRLAGPPLSAYTALRYDKVVEEPVGEAADSAPSAPQKPAAPKPATPAPKPPATPPNPNPDHNPNPKPRSKPATTARTPQGKPVPLGSFVAAGGRVYALAADRSAVYRWSALGAKWQRIGGPARRLFAGAGGLFATNPHSGDIHRFSGRPDTWIRIGGPGRSFVVSGGRLYGLSPDLSGVYEWTGKDDAWTKIGGPAGRISTADGSLFATNPDTGDLYRYLGSPHEWQRADDA
ncbi:hypothetical protein [Streptomyces cavernicola]|uniref:NlpC/P60 domain-containing protein n=1 Tax=Streptomyces cavernicola TaxID=3043613 RepID=A0ABT6S572_9ACTN|nr:hypothetical protein [Streptomyces sp. B-S-A6]MDI3403246.1 hypothetical protein [Streptomyces sp. B-S-A6]